MRNNYSLRIRHAYLSPEHQEALLVEENNEIYGIVNCPKINKFFRVPNEDMKRFEAAVASECLRDITTADQELANQLVEAIKSTEERGIVQLTEINAILNSLTSQ